MNIRKAIAADANQLSELALRSKMHWGYDEQFIQACQDDLTITAEYVLSHPVYVIEDDSRFLGFYSFLIEEQKLDFLYLEPTWIGRGLGRRMWEHILQTARDTGLTEFTIDSDPHAENFYLKMGANRIGEIESTVFAGRKLPLLQVKVRESW